MRWRDATAACRHDDIWRMYKAASASYWAVEEVDLSQDMRDWEKLSGARMYMHGALLALDPGSHACSRHPPNVRQA
jgi:hypothetical protein